MTIKSRSFWFHYNKPASLKAGKPQLTIHYMGACHVVDGVKIHVPIVSKNRARQPRCVMSGRCKSFNVSRRTAVVW